MTELNRLHFDVKDQGLDETRLNMFKITCVKNSFFRRRHTCQLFSVEDHLVNVVCGFVVQLLSVRMPNAAGRGERISTDFMYGSKNAVGWSLNFIKPLFGSVHLP